MANSKSARKRIRQNEVRRQRNVRVRSKLRTQITKLGKALEEGDVSKAEEQFRAVESMLDRAASKGVIPRKRASRKTGRLAKRLEDLRTQG